MVDFAKMLAESRERNRVLLEVGPTPLTDGAKLYPAKASPEQNVVVASALSKFLNKAKTDAKKIESLPAPKEKPPVWVDVPESEAGEAQQRGPSMDFTEYERASTLDSEEVDRLASGDSTESIDEISDEELLRQLEDDVEDSESSSDEMGEYDVEDEETDSKSFLGIPSESEAGLRVEGILLDESQVAALDALMNQQYGCLIGAAGSGKTTCTKELVHRLFYDERSTFKVKRSGQRFNVAFVAFTGMAVQVIKQNLPEWLHASCHTIHSLLEFAPTEQVSIDKKTGQPKVSRVFMPRRHEGDPLFEDLIIIDEASMLGMDLWNQLRKACKPGTRVIMIGDLNQLPPIIGEPIFAYALSQWWVSELTHIHRQKGAAGKIIEVAHAILNGDIQALKFDGMKNNPEWRVIGTKLNPRAQKAAHEILTVANNFRKLRFSDGTAVYDPFRDRIMTAGNGYGENGEKESDMVQQAPLNDALAVLIQPPSDENPRYIIDAGRAQRHFAVGNRVMATKNESPGALNRVTNGMTGIIKAIMPNVEYSGDKHKVGPEQEVRAHMRRAFGLSLSKDADESHKSSDDAMELAELHNEEIDIDALSNDLLERMSNTDVDDKIDKSDSANWCSHTVTVEFVNGAVREFWSKQQVESLQLAYASTVAKCQGSQFPTAIIVVHHAVKQQLCREWLYTAVTRAQGHVVILYTELGLRTCFVKQKIRGANLAEKIERYKELFEGVVGPMGGLMRKNVTLTVGPDYD